MAARQLVVWQRHKIVSGSSSIRSMFVVEWRQMKVCEDREKKAKRESVLAQETVAAEKPRQVPGSKQYYAYLLRCADGSLYAGYTTNLAKRVAVHNTGKGAKYTRSRLPVQLAYAEVFDTKEEALRRECALKRLRRKDKLMLAACWNGNDCGKEGVN